MLETAVWGAFYNVNTNLDDVKDAEFKSKVSTVFVIGYGTLPCSVYSDSGVQGP